MDTDELFKALHNGLLGRLLEILNDPEAPPDTAELNQIRMFLKDNGFDSISAGNHGVEYPGPVLEFPDHKNPLDQATGTDG